MNTFGMKVEAARYIEFSDAGELSGVDWDSLPEPLLFLGEGSNILFTGDFPGTVIHSKIKGIDTLEDMCVGDDVYVRAGSGESMDEVCRVTAAKGWWGAENLSGIPGSVGAAPVQNVGAYGVEAKDIIHSVECYDVRTRSLVTFDNAACAFGYRDSFFKHNRGRYIVLAVIFHLRRDFCPRLEYGHLLEEVERNAELAFIIADPYNPILSNEMQPQQPITPTLVRDTVKIMRDAKLPDPKKIGSAGSFFKNPVVSLEVLRGVEAVVAGEETGNSQAGGHSGGAAGGHSGMACGGHSGGHSGMACGGLSDGSKEGVSTVPHYLLEDGTVKIPAAFLIESCGLKGACVGGAAVWKNQPLVLVNASGRAEPQDILSLENLIIERVREKFGIELSAEVDHI